MANYITVQNVLDKLIGVDVSKITNLNEKLQTVFIPTAQIQVNQYIGYNIATVTQTKYFDGNDQTMLPLKMKPIQDVSAVVIYYVPYSSEYQSVTSDIAKINTLDIFGNEITTDVPPSTTTKLIVDCAHGELLIPEADQTLRLWFGTPGFIRGRANVKVTLTSGYPDATMPQQIKDAAAYQAAILALLSLSNSTSHGASSIKIGQVTKQFGFGTGKTLLAYSGAMKQFEEAAKLLLNPFRIITV